MRHQPRELRGDVVDHLLRRPRVLQLAQRGGVLGRAPSPACAATSLRDQRQPRRGLRRRAARTPRRRSAAGRRGRRGRARRSTICSRSSSGAAERHVGDRHLLQVGDVLLEVLQRARGSAARPAGAGRRGACAAATSGSSKTSISTCVAVVDQRRKADQRLRRRLRTSISSGSSPKVQAVYCSAAGGAYGSQRAACARRLAAAFAACPARRSRRSRSAAGRSALRRAWRRRPPSAPPAPGTPSAPGRPARPSAPRRLRPMPSWRPCSSTTRKFMNRCGGSCLELEVVALHGELGAFAHVPCSSASSRPPCANGASAHELVGVVRQRHQPRARPLVQALHERQHLVLQQCRAPATRSVPR